MKTCHALSASLLIGGFAALQATAARDPFWPVGYEPPKPEPAAQEAPEPAKAPPAPAPKPAVRPVTDADWAAARKAVVISGFTQTVLPGTQESRLLAMINRTMVAAGDTVTFLHQNIRFHWRAETISTNTVQLVPLSAARVAQKPSDLKQNP